MSEQATMRRRPARPRSSDAAARLEPLERGAVGFLCVVVAVAVIPFGATGPVAMPIALLCASIWCGFASLLSRRPWPGVSQVAIGASALLAAYMLLQAATVHILPTAPSYAEAAVLLGEPLLGTASIAPGRTIDAIAPVVLPLVLFALACRLLRTDQAALDVLRFLSVMGGGVAVFGILQNQFAPDFVLFSTKTSYRGDLTAVFVNRNTAATFLGGTLLIALSLVAYAIGRRPTLPTLATVTLQRRDRGILLHGGIALIALMALTMTSSRAGGVASLLAATILVALLYRRNHAEHRVGRRRSTAFLWRWLGSFAIALLVVVPLSGRILNRMLVQGADDGRFCVYPDIWRLALTVWPWGSGGGTFELAFRPFRDPACGVHGSWDRAHSFFLEGLVVLGLPFCLAAFACLWTLAATLRRGLHDRRAFRSGPALGIALTVLLVLHDLVDFSLQIPGIALWSAVGLAACCSLCDRKRAAVPAAAAF